MTARPIGEFFVLEFYSRCNGFAATCRAFLLIIAERVVGFDVDKGFATLPFGISLSP